MFNFHGGTVISGTSLPAGNFAAFVVFHNTSHMIIVWGLMILTCLSMTFLIATLTRFFINFKKCNIAFKQPERIPY